MNIIIIIIIINMSIYVCVLLCFIVLRSLSHGTWFRELPRVASEHRRVPLAPRSSVCRERGLWYTSQLKDVEICGRERDPEPTHDLIWFDMIWYQLMSCRHFALSGTISNTRLNQNMNSLVILGSCWALEFRPSCFVLLIVLYTILREPRTQHGHALDWDSYESQKILTPNGVWRLRSMTPLYKSLCIRVYTHVDR